MHACHFFFNTFENEVVPQTCYCSLLVLRCLRLKKKQKKTVVDTSISQHRTQLLGYANTIFTNQLDHSPNLPPCNFIHFTKMKMKLKSQLDEIQLAWQVSEHLSGTHTDIYQ